MKFWKHLKKVWWKFNRILEFLTIFGRFLRNLDPSDVSSVFLNDLFEFRWRGTFEVFPCLCPSISAWVGFNAKSFGSSTDRICSATSTHWIPWFSLSHSLHLWYPIPNNPFHLDLTQSNSQYCFSNPRKTEFIQSSLKERFRNFLCVIYQSLLLL